MVLGGGRGGSGGPVAVPHGLVWNDQLNVVQLKEGLLP
jgi:hypothetical protein